MVQELQTCSIFIDQKDFSLPNLQFTLTIHLTISRIGSLCLISFTCILRIIEKGIGFILEFLLHLHLTYFKTAIVLKVRSYTFFMNMKSFNTCIFSGIQRGVKINEIPELLYNFDHQHLSAKHPLSLHLMIFYFQFSM